MLSYTACKPGPERPVLRLRAEGSGPDLRNRLAEIREARGLTQQQVADALNTTGPSVSRWERDDGALSIGNLSRLAKLLKVSIGQIVGEVPFTADDERRDTAAPLERDRLAAVADALDFEMEETGAAVAPGARGDLLLAIYDWTVQEGLKLSEIRDLSRIRPMLRPLLTRPSNGAAPSAQRGERQPKR